MRRSPGRLLRFVVLLLLAVVAIRASLVRASASHAVATPASAPGFSLPGRGGEVVLDSLRGRVVYVDFWASWCDPCRKSFPWLQAMQAKYDSVGLTVVGVNLDKDHALSEAFLRQHPASFRIAYDPAGKVAEAYKIKVMPSSVLIGRDGTVIAMHTGFDAKQADAVEARIREALAR